MPRVAAASAAPRRAKRSNERETALLLQAIAFWLLAPPTVASALAVISARNPVHSVLFLITAFFSAAGLFVLLGAEFLAMLLVVVYVGAVAVLFLFVVMMLDVDFAELRQGFARYLPIGLARGRRPAGRDDLGCGQRSRQRAGAADGQRPAHDRRTAGRHQRRDHRPGALHRLRLLSSRRRGWCC